MLPEPPAAAPRDASPNRWPLRRGYLLAVLVLIGSLMLVVWYSRSAREREARVADAENVIAAERVSTLIQERLLRYELAIRGGVSLFASVRRPTEQQWRGYIDGLRLHRQFPGMMGLGYAPSLHSDALQALQLETRAGGGGLFTVRPAGVREFYGPILYLEPGTPANRAAIGYDMFSEPERKVAMEAARDSGQIKLSAPVNLLQQTGTSAERGLLMYAPVYAGGLDPSAPAARRTAMTGWVYAPFAVEEFITGIGGIAHGEYALRIVDVTAGDALVHRDGSFADAPQSDAWRHSIVQEAYGRRWRIDFQTLGPGLGSTSQDLQMTLLAGLFVSLLLFAVTLSLAHTQSRAERIAQRMSESYRRSEQRFRSAMEYSVAGIVLLDRAGNIVEANAAIETLFGVAPGALVGRELASMFTRNDARWDRERDRGIAEHGAYRTTRRLWRTDGDVRQLQLVFTPVPGEIGSGVAWLVQVEDITDRLRAEEQIREMNRLLEARVAQRTRELVQSNRELESFAYSVSHDLRAPLRSVEGFAHVLGERHATSLDDDGRGYLARIRNAALRMDALIDALLRLSRITREELTLGAVDLGQLAEDVAAELRQGDPGRDVEVRIATGLRAAGDPALLRDLLQNLLGNAWKFTRDADAAAIEFGEAPLREGEEGVRAFVVADNGAGFEPDYAGKLFRPFQRLHDADRFAGHGIGLATVKRIVERHGGSIEAEGEPGRGAKFRFTLPDVESITAD